MALIEGTDGDDTLFGTFDDGDTILGHAGNDWIEGGGGDVGDLIDGGTGDDYVRSGLGADTLMGGDGADTLSYLPSGLGVSVNLGTNQTSGGDASQDTISGFENVEGSLNGDDALIGSAGDNVLRGLGGSDILEGAAGADTLGGDDGNDILRGGAGADQLDGEAGTDTASYYTGTAGVAVNLTSGTGSGGEAQGDILTGIDNLSGSQGNDSLVGNNDANVLQGWNGNDVLTGAGGKDTLTGGAGADRFVYGGITQSPVGAGADRITDFSHVQGDHIDLTAIDADTGAPGDQAFRFIGTGAYSHHAGELRTAVAGGVTTIAGDVNGDGTSDFHIQLTGALALAAADFVL
ncbi:calcium-binding protein [Inquilinus sp. YAF38]|uniref:calcium-binding protein n=1 Tax=Inquilinus sp. YAF38 TaxID=3233084 RepID=UPI003F8EE054